MKSTNKVPRVKAMAKVKVRGNPPGKSPDYLTSQEESSTTAGALSRFQSYARGQTSDF